jgi:PE family
MTDTANIEGLYFDPATATDAASRLDALAQRLHDDLQAGQPTLTVVSAGTDEVSMRAAGTMNDVAASFSESAAAGVLELQKLAATLRAQVTHFGRVESGSAAGLEAARVV